jgi:hypothetical protein
MLSRARGRALAMLFVTALARSCYNKLDSETSRGVTTERIGVTKQPTSSVESGYLACNPHRPFLPKK